jgi:hypothetical protein
MKHEINDEYLQWFADRWFKKLNLPRLQVTPYESNCEYGSRRVICAGSTDIISRNWEDFPYATDLSEGFQISFRSTRAWININKCIINEENKELLDACIIHEILHSKYLSHSREFYEELKKYNAHEGIETYEEYLKEKGYGFKSGGNEEERKTNIEKMKIILKKI